MSNNSNIMQIILAFFYVNVYGYTRNQNQNQNQQQKKSKSAFIVKYEINTRPLFILAINLGATDRAFGTRFDCSFHICA